MRTSLAWRRPTLAGVTTPGGELFSVMGFTIKGDKIIEIDIRTLRSRQGVAGLDGERAFVYCAVLAEPPQFGDPAAPLLRPESAGRRRP